jgi:uncharacterized protein
MRKLILAALFLLAALAPSEALVHFDTSTLSIDTGGGNRGFTIELALSPEQQQQGLMFRRTMAADAGMLFIFQKTGDTAFWMKNTLIPLDMLFIAEDGHIADIHERAVPMSEASIPAKFPVKAVLELNGGTVARLGIKIGDLVHYSVFGTAKN